MVASVGDPVNLTMIAGVELSPCLLTKTFTTRLKRRECYFNKTGPFQLYCCKQNIIVVRNSCIQTIEAVRG